MRGRGRRDVGVLLGVAALLIGVVVPGSPVQATHSWGGYHWARISNPFTLKIGNNVSSAWDSYLRDASKAWSTSAVLHTAIEAGSTSPKTCKASSGKVQVCNATYGRTGWLGVASVWLSGTHITQATVKLNDTYFNTTQYNTSPWRNLVTCQELGHTFGLDHQDVDFYNANLGTCMDYTNIPGGDISTSNLSNEFPNAHDYEQLVMIYTPTDLTSTVAGATVAAIGDVGNSPASWGQLMSGTAKAGSVATYVRRSGNDAVFTFVIWA